MERKGFVDKQVITMIRESQRQGENLEKLVFKKDLPMSDFVINTLEVRI